MSGRFLDNLVLQTYARGEWVLMQDFRYQSADGEIYTAPKYFITDLASTPWIVKPLLAGIEDRPCGVIHDFLFCENKLSRVVCAALYYEMTCRSTWATEGPGQFTRSCIWGAVQPMLGVPGA